MCPQERLFIISRTTGLSFVLKMIGPLTAIIIAALYLLAFYLFAISNTPENPFASICSKTFIGTARQHLLLLVGFDTLIYRKYCDTPPILVGHQNATLDGILHEEELKRYQRSKAQFLLEGDSNTRYFHSFANVRHRKKCIHSLVHDEG